MPNLRDLLGKILDRLGIDRGKLPTPDDRFRQFLYGNNWTSFTSTYLKAARYDWNTSTLQVLYPDGTVWSYRNVTPGEARDFYEAPSKGTWMWDNVRVRGTKSQHQKPAGLEYFT